MKKLLQEFLSHMRNGESISDVKSSAVARSRGIYVNRNVRMQSVKMVGFDMDYTLAEYDREAFERLAFELTVGKLIKKKGYPNEIRRIEYDPGHMIRGLVVDKVTGNLLKADCFEYVQRAYHGNRALTRDERKKMYASKKLVLSDDRFSAVDTMFSLPEIYLYSALVEFFDDSVGKGPHQKLRALGPEEKSPPPLPDPSNFPWLLDENGCVNYGRLFDDIRDMLDEAHADYSLKSVVVKDVGRYIRRDPNLASTLQHLRMNGKVLFLLTNSEWTYTNSVMTYLLGSESKDMPNWQDYFDVVVCAARKPGFFSQKEPFFQVDNLRTGAATETSDAKFKEGRIYTGGNLNDFEHMARKRGGEILYVGDHIYGDILRSKKTSLWRTCMIVSELEEEVAKAEGMQSKIEKLERLNKEKGILDLKESLTLESIDKFKEFKLQNFELLTKNDLKQLDLELNHAIQYVTRVNANLTDILVKINKLEKEVDTSFNTFWGQVFREDTENTRFAEQIRDYACLYTSRVSNFAEYSPTHYFQSPKELMPHEL